MVLTGQSEDANQIEVALSPWSIYLNLRGILTPAIESQSRPSSTHMRFLGSEIISSRCAQYSHGSPISNLSNEKDVPRSHSRMCSCSEAGSYARRIDSCITQLKAPGPSRTCLSLKYFPGPVMGVKKKKKKKRANSRQTRAQNRSTQTKQNVDVGRSANPCLSGVPGR